MSSYPDNIESLGQPGPSHSTLRVQYYEEHGFMPGPELDRELVDNYWQGLRSNQEVNDQFCTDNLDPILQQQQQQHYGDVVEMSDGGHEKLIQRRPDLAPFMHSASPEIFGGADAASQPGFGHGYVLDQPPFPVAHDQLREPLNFPPAAPTYTDAFVGGPPSDNQYGVPYVGGGALVPESGGPSAGGAAPIHDYGFAPDGPAAPVPDNGAYAMIERPVPAEDDPFVTNTASTPAGSARPARFSAPTSAPQKVIRRKSKNVWTEAEMALLIFLKEEKNLKWDAILRILGTHTRSSVPDKYYELCRKRRGLKK